MASARFVTSALRGDATVLSHIASPLLAMCSV